MSNSGAVDLSPFEYDFQGPLDVLSPEGDCSDVLCDLDDIAGALQAKTTNKKLIRINKQANAFFFSGHPKSLLEIRTLNMGS